MHSVLEGIFMLVAGLAVALCSPRIIRWYLQYSRKKLQQSGMEWFMVLTIPLTYVWVGVLCLVLIGFGIAQILGR